MKQNSNKKIIITVAVFAAVIIVFALLLKLIGSADKNGDDSVISDDGVSVEYNSDDYITEYTTKEVTTVAQMNQSSITLEEIAIMNAYIYGQYYMDGVIEADGSPMEFDLAISGKNYQMSMRAEGMNISMMYLNGNVYLIDKSAKIYLALTDMLKSSMDDDFSEMEEITKVLSLASYNFTDFKEGTTEIDGKKANSYTYYNDSESVAFCFINNELKQVNYGDGYGNVASSVIVNKFSAQIPSGMLTLAGLKGVSPASFLSSYAELFS